MKEKFDVNGMSCSACSARVEKVVNAIDGVNTATVNLLQNMMVVDFDEDKTSVQDIEDRVTDIGFEAEAQGKKKQ